MLIVLGIELYRLVFSIFSQPFTFISDFQFDWFDCFKSTLLYHFSLSYLFVFTWLRHNRFRADGAPRRELSMEIFNAVDLEICWSQFNQYCGLFHKWVSPKMDSNSWKFSFLQFDVQKIEYPECYVIYMDQLQTWFMASTVNGTPSRDWPQTRHVKHWKKDRLTFQLQFLSLG